MTLPSRTVGAIEIIDRLPVLLSNLLHRKGVSAIEFAKLIGMSSSWTHRLLHGESDVNIKLATLSTILKWIGENDPSNSVLRYLKTQEKRATK